MRFLVVVFLIATVADKIVHRKVEVYAGEESGWLRLQLNKDVLGKRHASVNGIRWCGTGYTNTANSVNELRHCSDPGLMHAVLYPSTTPKVEIHESEPNVIYIDPKFVGGQNLNRQARIVVDADIVGAPNEKLIQVFKFNPLEKSASSFSSSSKSPTPGPSNDENPIFVDDVEHAIPEDTVENNHVDETIPISEDNDSITSSLQGMGILFSIGMFVIVGAGYIINNRMRHRRAVEDSPALVLRKEGNLDMDEFMRIGADEDYDNDKDVSILMQMGHGANPAFSRNM